ncbi:MAG: HAD family phosphatase [Acidobacteriota bacterium]
MKTNGAVIFDMDGLMVDTEAMAIEAWQEAARAQDAEITRELCIGMIGLNQRDSEQLLSDTLGPAFPLEPVRDRFLRGLQERIETGRIDAKPGLFELLDYLESNGVPKAVATSSGREEAAKKLRAIGVLHRFPVIVTSDQVARGKPAPDLFLLAASRLGVEPACCTVLEDSEAGIRAAHAAGMRPVMVPDIKPPSDAIVSLAAQVFPTLQDVHRFLAGESGGPA